MQKLLFKERKKVTAVKSRDSQIKDLFERLSEALIKLL